ncbi:MAG: mechanosensitive ion channel [Lamprobacter sp.]|uniref:mechanosensitive ion channel domain-containing protein n=1 Tax=Lamprobacter sp. TaxID=3100796 RepID=UPI002B2639BF|nr:mechanosensitive ion channel domain-containing protein [Lamprobacter sp.]MEA3639718.1 mechanosensitive ion channel [Lamprobacter sp.]
MILKYSLSASLLWLALLLPLLALAQEDDTSAPASAASEQGAEGDQATAPPAAEAEAEAEPAAAAQETDALPFNPAAIGLPALPQPMTSAEDFQVTLDLIDARIAEQEAALEAAQAEAEEAAAALEAEAQEASGAADAEAQESQQAGETETEAEGESGVSQARETGDDEATAAEAETELDAAAEAEEKAAAEAKTGADAGTETEAAASADVVEGKLVLAALEARVAKIRSKIELLRELRIAVQRRATLRGRLQSSEAELAEKRQQLEIVERDGVSLEPPFPISLLDQQRAERSMTQGVKEVAETRIESATRRLNAAEKELTAAVRARRAVRDRLTAADRGGARNGISATERAALEQDLELARLKELLARQQLAALQSTLELTRNEDRLAEIQQAMLDARIAFLEPRIELSREALDQRLTELSATEAEMKAQIEALQRTGDQAESDLYQAQRRLAEAEADDGADQASLKEWVSTRQAELTAARVSVDSLTAAVDTLIRMRGLWEQRYQLMNDPESLDLAALLRQIIMDASAAQAEKDEVEERLNALRSIQLAQTRRLRDPDLSEGAREAMAVRSQAQDLAEGYGRALLEVQDELIALLEGMRPQVEALVQEQTLSLQLLQAQETISTWWEAEILVIDDQSIRARELAVAILMFVVVIVVVSLVRMGARRALNRRKAKSPTAVSGDFRLALSAIAGNTSQLFVLIAAFYVAMVFSGLASPTVKDWLWTLLVVAFYIQLGIWANAAMVDYFNRRRTRQEMRDPSTVTAYGLLLFFLRVGIWITVIVSLLAYFRYPVAGLVGALGVGSLAIAFAVQNILGDVFSSMAIILDKPFRVGDFIMSGQTLGVIEHIGVKTTRIRSLSGEMVVLSNSDLLNSRIHNFKHFKERRIAFKLQVTYQTPRHLIEQIPVMIREVIEDLPNARFDRAHFAEFGDFALVFEAVYYVLSPDYALYMDVQQAINLGIHQRFEEAGVAFAYPTQELLLRRLPEFDSGSSSTLSSTIENPA